MNAVNESSSDTETASQSSNTSSIHHPVTMHISLHEASSSPSVRLCHSCLMPTGPEPVDYNPPVCIKYVMEWKVAFNNREIRIHTEDNLVVAPSESSVERQLQAWSHLLRIGKRLKVDASFKFAESGKAARTAGRGATPTRLAESDVRIDAEQASLGDTSPYRHVYQVFRCPGPPCDRGPYCWVDPNDHKHYKLMTHQFKSLVKFVREGNTLQGPDDVPDYIREQLYAEEQQLTDRRKKRKQDAKRYPEPPTSCALDSSVPRSLPLSIPGLRDEAVKEYCRWHCSQVGSLDQKKAYELARDLTLARSLDLELVDEDNDAQFYVDKGVSEGVARRFVRDVHIFLEQYV
ncbi:hypothetical protein Purlil1_13760 [Purpureocillium lilacinum]|uniref:C2H2-type domain-containing protein n=1 Tax=Purpureocillium lilacinum TaxID=33203 RepID=A0ABR0BDU6_PURLI|nr:hypothetical protein Purlil1_13760 [Purpureocillium lilacinum]